MIVVVLTAVRGEVQYQSAVFAPVYSSPFSHCADLPIMALVKLSEAMLKRISLISDDKVGYYTSNRY